MEKFNYRTFYSWLKSKRLESRTELTTEHPGNESSKSPLSIIFYFCSNGGFVIRSLWAGKAYEYSK